MTRAKSAILTVAEKKTVINNVKANIRDLVAANKVITKGVATRSKEFEKAQKADEKNLAVGLKALSKLENELAGLIGNPVVA